MPRQFTSELILTLEAIIPWEHKLSYAIADEMLVIYIWYNVNKLLPPDQNDHCSHDGSKKNEGSKNSESDDGT